MWYFLLGMLVGFLLTVCLYRSILNYISKPVFKE